MPLRRELARAGGLPRADLLNVRFRGSLRNMRGHGDEIFHSQLSPCLAIAGFLESEERCRCLPSRPGWARRAREVPRPDAWSAAPGVLAAERLGTLALAEQRRLAALRSCRLCATGFRG